MDNKEADADLAAVLAQLTNLIMNERIRAYNEGVDAERDRCIKAAAATMGIEPESAGGPLFDALRDEPDDTPTESIRRGAQLLHELYGCRHCGGRLKDHKPDCPTLR